MGVEGGQVMGCPITQCTYSKLLTLSNKKVTTHNDPTGILKPVDKHLMVELPADK